MTSGDRRAAGGTSKACVRYLCDFSTIMVSIAIFPSVRRLRTKEAAEIAPGSAAIRCLETGGVVMIRCWLENCPHYVLLTGIMEQGVALFDPYEDTQFYDWEQDGVLRVEDEPRRWNRIVTMDRLNAVDNQDYAMGEVCKREESADLELCYGKEGIRKSPEERLLFRFSSGDSADLLIFPGLDFSLDALLTGINVRTELLPAGAHIRFCLGTAGLQPLLQRAVIHLHVREGVELTAEQSGLACQRFPNGLGDGLCAVAAGHEWPRMANLAQHAGGHHRVHQEKRITSPSSAHTANCRSDERTSRGNGFTK